MMQFDWRREGVVDELRRLHAEGLSNSEIARALTKKFGGELSRNAVIGKVHRIGLNQTHGPASAPRLVAPEVRRNPASRATPRPAGRKNMSPLARQKFAQPAGEAISPSAPPREVSALVAVDPKPWTERGKGCAWPVAGVGADTLSCCNPTGGHTYCETHRAVMVGSMPKSWEGYSQPSFARKMGSR